MTTYLYSDVKENPFSLPRIDDEHCVALSNADVFQERDDAWAVLARMLQKIQDNEDNVDLSTVKKDIEKFFTKIGRLQSYQTLISK